MAMAMTATFSSYGIGNAEAQQAVKAEMMRSSINKSAATAALTKNE